MEGAENCFSQKQQGYLFLLLFLLTHGDVGWTESRDLSLWQSRNVWFPTMWHFDKGYLEFLSFKGGCTDSSESVQPPLKLRNSKWCSISSLTLLEYSSDKHRLWSDCTYAQAGLSLCWSHIPHYWKSHVAAHVLILSLSHPGILGFM